jgi:uncharacterized membrane protein HdeD (DUF308 family)
MAGVIHENVAELRRSWGWFLALGILLTLLGLVALSYSCIATITTVLVFGYFLLIGGVFHIVGAFFTRGWGGLFLGLLAGVLYLAAGFIVVNHPTEAAIVYTLLIAVFFFVDGLFYIFAALTGRFRHRGWVLLSGIVTLILGVMIWKQWPLSGLFVVGLFVGINLIFSGVGYMMLGLSARRLPA